MSQLSIIAAVATNGVIGINNTLPWHLPEDLKRFKVLTMGHHIIMGRKTYESLGRLLPGRITVIVTRNPNYVAEGAIVTASLEAAIKACGDDDEVFLIGGAELYQAGLKVGGKLYLTEVHATFDGDAHLPAFNLNCWQETSREAHKSKNDISFSYVTYERIHDECEKKLAV